MLFWRGTASEKKILSIKRCTNSCGCANRMNTGNENEVSPLQCTYERMLIEISDALGEELYEMDPKRFAEEFG